MPIRFPARPSAFAAVLAVCFATGLVAAPQSVAAPAPIKDPDSSGYLGFCDDQGEQVRSGLVGAAPFAWKIVSSEKAPENYAKGRALVAVFQPRPGVDPGEWSGKQLTASSTFSNPRHPMAEATRADSALIDFTAVYRPRVNGLVQLRMFLGAPNTPQNVRPYPATFVRVSGDRWTQVDGGAVNCAAGNAVSSERRVLTPQQLNPTQSRPSPVSAKHARHESATRASSAPAGASSSAGATGTVGDAPTSVDASRAAAERDDSSGDRSDGSGTTLLIFGLIFLVVLAASGVLIARQRRAGQD